MLIPALLVFSAASIWLGVIDARTKTLPNRIVLPLFPVLAALLALAAALEGRWDRYLQAWLAAIALFMGYLVLHLIYPAGLGFGDVKLAPSLGLVLGYFSWQSVLFGTTLGFTLAAVVSLVLLLSRKKDRKGDIPFGPYMLAGAWLIILANLIWPSALT